MVDGSREVHILLAGDRGVGKTSLIMALMKERFCAEVPPLAPEVTVPPDVTPEHVTTYITDSSLRVQEESEISAAMRKADVICLVYAVDSPDSFERLMSYWLPLARSAREGLPTAPVLLVGNKTDTRASETNPHLHVEAAPVMHAHPEVEMVVECSAGRLRNISEVFYLAQKAVLHPSPPLYDARLRALRPAAEAALTRVFHLCDADQDGLLDDAELNAFQVACFAQPLSPQELASVKDVVRAADAAGVAAGGVTRQGFLAMQTLFIAHGRLESTWAVLRRFGYADTLELTAAAQAAGAVAAGPIAADASVELSAAGEAFLLACYRRHARAADGLVPLAALAKYTAGHTWRGAPADALLPPFADSPAARADSAAVTLPAFLGAWRLLALDDPVRCMAALSFLGYGAPPAATSASGPAALTVTRGRVVDRAARATARTVFVAAVVGSTGSGKTTLLRALAAARGGAGCVSLDPASLRRSAVAAADDPASGTRRWLVLREIAAGGADADLLASPTALAAYDAVLFLYDASELSSFSYVANLAERLPASGPAALFVATKADLPAVVQVHASTPAAFCAARGLPAPLPVAAAEPATAAATALDTVAGSVVQRCMDVLARGHGRRVGSGSGGLLTLAVIVGLAAVAAGAYFRFARRA